MLPRIEPVIPARRGDMVVAKNPSRYCYEPKFDGFRCIAYLEEGKVDLVTKTGKRHQGFAEVKSELIKLPVESAIFDGELVCLDNEGRPKFEALMRRQKPVYYGMFDLLYFNGEDLRMKDFLKRKKMLDAVTVNGELLFTVKAFASHQTAKLLEFIKEQDMEGVVAKLKHAPYDPSLKDNWVKIINPGYSQYKNRWQWFSGQSQISRRNKV